MQVSVITHEVRAVGVRIELWLELRQTAARWKRV